MALLLDDVPDQPGPATSPSDCTTAGSRWVSAVLGHLEDYRGELRALMTEKFHILDKQEIPVQYREAA